MSPLALVPSGETSEFSKLTETLKTEVILWLKVVQQIGSAKSVSAGIQAVARQYAGARGMSAANIRTKFYAYKERGWQALINKSKLPKNSLIAPNTPQGQPAMFIDYWKGLQENYQRNSKAAYHELIRLYRSGEQIPGIGNWRNVWMESVGGRPPEKCPLDAPLPEGWTYRNLSRYKPTKFELTVCRIGRGAAAKYRPKVNTTRVGMDIGQIYVFDDVWHDNVVTILGQRKPMRPLEFCCIDYFSGCQVAWGAQPIVEDLDTGKRKMLEEKEMLFLLTEVLCGRGFHPGGCQLQMEHGSATVRKDLEELLLKVSGDRLLVEKGGIDRRAAHDGYFMCRPKGNSRFKAALESFHNLKHNELAALPGQVGRNRDSSPEHLHGLMAYNEDLLKVCEQYPELVDRLTFPTLEINQWKQATQEIYNRINGRIDHNLEGWLEAGLVQNRFLLIEGGDEIPMESLLTMDPKRRAAVEAAMIPLPPRKLSPIEVYASRMPMLETLPMSVAPLILGEQNAQPKRLGHDHQFELEDMRIGPGILRYLGQAHTETGEIVQLDPGREYLLWLSPFNPSGAFIAHIDGRFIGAVKRWEKPCRTDTQKVHEQIGKAEAFHALLLKPVKNRHAAEAGQRTRMINDNNKVMVQAGLRPNKKVRQPAFEDRPAPVNANDLINYYNGGE